MVILPILGTPLEERDFAARQLDSVDDLRLVQNQKLPRWVARPHKGLCIGRAQHCWHRWAPSYLLHVLFLAPNCLLPSTPTYLSTTQLPPALPSVYQAQDWALTLTNLPLLIHSVSSNPEVTTLFPGCSIVKQRRWNSCRTFFAFLWTTWRWSSCWVF